MPRIYTRQGDDDEWSHEAGGRVSKADPVTEACGTVWTSAVAILGLARAHTKIEAERELLGPAEPFVVGADLATNPDERGSSSPASRS